MEQYFDKNIKIICEEFSMSFIVRPIMCWTLTGGRKIEGVGLSDFSYGQYLFFVRGVPLYYFNSVDPKLKGTTLEKWIDAIKTGQYVGDKVLSLLKKTGIPNVSNAQCKSIFNFSVGEPYKKEFHLLEIRDIELAESDSDGRF